MYLHLSYHDIVLRGMRLAARHRTPARPPHRGKARTLGGASTASPRKRQPTSRSSSS